MITITCDACSKRYRIDETRMKSATARVRCKACGHTIHVSRPPAAAPTALPLAADAPPAAPADAADLMAAAGIGDYLDAALPTPPAAEDGSPADVAAAPALIPPQKVRFGLFGKTLLVMLLISLLPFGIFGLLTFKETSDRIRGDSESLMAQTAKGLGDQVDAWINANLGVLRTIARLPDIVSMNREQQESALRAVNLEYPWMYLVFTVAPDGMNVARSDGQPLVSYADRKYVADVLGGKAVGWQSVVGRTSNLPALVLAVPHGGRHDCGGHVPAYRHLEERQERIRVFGGRQGFCAFASQEAAGRKTRKPERPPPDQRVSQKGLDHPEHRLYR